MRPFGSQRFLIPFLLLFAVLAVPHFAVAQDASDPPAANPNSNANVSLDPNETPTPVPFSDIIDQAKSTSSSLKEMAAGIENDPAVELIERELPGLTKKIDTRLSETANMIEGRPAIEGLRSFENDWNSLVSDLPRWKADLAKRADALDKDLVQLKQADAKWKKTLNELKGIDVPPEVTNRVNEIIAVISNLRTNIETQQTRTVALQGAVAEQQDRADEALDSIKKTRESLVGRLFVRDSPAIWTAEFWNGARQDISPASARTVTSQIDAIFDFAAQNKERIAVHILIFLLLAGGLLFARRSTAAWAEKEPALKNASVIFRLAIPTAFAIAIFLNSWIYEQLPQIMKAIFGAAVLIPTVMIVRNLVARPVYPILYSLVVFFFVDQFRSIIEPLPVLFRLVLMSETLLGAMFFSWIYFGKLARNETEEVVYGPLFKTIKTASIVAVPIFAVSFLANAFGFVGLARLTGNAVLTSAYAAVILYAFVRIMDGLIIFALRVRPLNMLGMVKNNRAFIQNRIRTWCRWLLFILWAILTLDLLSLFDPLASLLRSIFGYAVTIGAVTISLSDIAAFALTVWAAFMLSRVVRFVLNEDIYPRTQLSRGMPYAISTVLNYAILLVGFFLALAAVGLDLTKFTVLAGAFGVGIGFGLQNIVNNFVSGLILLFERPVSVGDTVQVADDEGDLVRIGLRASILRTAQGSEVIVPNSELISKRVVNWTLTQQQRRIDIDVKVSAANDPHKVIGILRQTAEANDKILTAKPPSVILVGFDVDSMTFQVRVWTDHFSEWLTIKSELTFAVHDALKENRIKM